MNTNVRATDMEIKLDPVPEAPARARAFARQHLTALGFPNKVDDGVLIVAELVTNSLKYAADYGPIWVSIRLASGRALLEVVGDVHPVGQIPEVQSCAASSEATRRTVQRMLDLQETALNEEQ